MHITAHSAVETNSEYMSLDHPTVICPSHRSPIPHQVVSVSKLKTSTVQGEKCGILRFSFCSFNSLWNLNGLTEHIACHPT